MPMKRRRSKQSGLDYWKIEQLVVGWPMMAGMGYSAGITDGCSHWGADKWDKFRAAMRADWDIYGAAFMKWWRGETEQFTAAFSQFEPKRPDPSVTPWAAQEWGDPSCQ